MVLLFEENSALKIFDEPFAQAPFSFILASKEFMLGEVSRNFKKVTGIRSDSLAKLKQSLGKNDLTIDDIVKVRNFECDASSLKETYDANEAEITFENIVFLKSRIERMN